MGTPCLKGGLGVEWHQADDVAVSPTGARPSHHVALHGRLVPGKEGGELIGVGGDGEGEKGQVEEQEESPHLANVKPTPRLASLLWFHCF